MNLTQDDGIVVVEVGEADIMVRGLQARISGTELNERIADRIRKHEVTATALEFGELLPEKPRSMEQQEYEERTAVGFHLGRLAKRLAV